MGLSMKTRKELTASVAKRYRAAARKEKTIILNEFAAATGYNRAYAAMLLRGYGKKVLETGKGADVAYVASKGAGHAAGGRPRVYPKEVARVVERLWRLFGSLCGKRLVPVIRAVLPFLHEATEFLHVSPEIVHMLDHISPATVDRLLTKARAAMRLKGTGYTRGTAALVNQIPVRTFGDWRHVPPGHVQIDLVGHDGGIASGQCCFTLTAADVCSGWTERRAVLNRASRWVLEALKDIRAAIPFPLIEIHPDNGSEFINYALIDWCARTSLIMTRSRAGKKNDNGYVEQKNFDTVRKIVGYARYTTPEAVDILNALYQTHALLQNYVYPSQKLIEKTRIGSRVIKHYDQPQTPADRLLNHPAVDERVKQKIRAIQQTLNPLHLAAEVSRLQSALLRAAARQPAQPYSRETSA